MTINNNYNAILLVIYLIYVMTTTIIVIRWILWMITMLGKRLGGSGKRDTDDELFKQTLPKEECPICMLPLPLDADKYFFSSCCGKVLCAGCIYAMAMEEIKKDKEFDEHLCAFCRSPHHSSNEEGIERLAKLMDNGNADAFDVQAGHYANGTSGIPQDWAKANELWLKAGELGCAGAYSKLGYSYYNGREVDEKKAKHYWELAAMMGDVCARHNLGLLEVKAGNHQRTFKHVDKEMVKYYWELAAMNRDVLARHILGLLEGNAGNDERAMKHFMVAARAGHTESLDLRLVLE